MRRIRRDQSCDIDETELQSNQLKGLNIPSDISLNMDLFNRRFLTQIPKVALDYDVDLSRYYPKVLF